MLKREFPKYEADATRIVIAGMTFVSLLAVLLLPDGCINLNPPHSARVARPAPEHR
jgi:hypothetical protein